VQQLASNIVGFVSPDQEIAILRRTWTLPILTVAHTPKRFTEIRSELFSITDRALSKSLDQLQELKWVHREIDIEARPPRPSYQAVNTGLKICQTVNNSL